MGRGMGWDGMDGMGWMDGWMDGWMARCVIVCMDG